MDAPNAFIGRKVQPTAEELSQALGPAATQWKQLLDWFSEEQHVTDHEWKSSSPKWGWTLLLILKKRRIAYLSPCAGCFRVSFILGDRAVTAARQSDLSPRVIKLLDQAPHYAEGTGLRLPVKGAKDLAQIRKLALVKLAN
jgi:hypothetical protein